MLLLSDIPVGTRVRVWCIGPSRWDELTAIITKKNGFYVEVEYANGATDKFVPNAKAKIVEGNHD